VRAKYNAIQQEKIRLGLIVPAYQKNIRKKERMREKLHPVLEKTTIEAMFRGAGKEPVVVTRRKAMQYVRLLSDRHPKLDALAVAWDKMSDSKQRATPLEDLCAQVGLPVTEFIALVAPRAYEMGHKLARLFVGLAQPELAKVSIEAGLDKENGFKDRQMMLQAGGTAPSPKGIQIAVQQTNVSAGELPDFDNQTIDLADTVRGD
jgi:hypothetical protein